VRRQLLRYADQADVEAAGAAVKAAEEVLAAAKSSGVDKA